MTGFPGETDGDFALLLDFQEKAQLDWMGCFVYSREEGTPAWAMKGRVSGKTAARRKRILEERQVPLTEKRMERLVGRVFDVLVEGRFETDAGSANAGGVSLYLGRLFCHAPEVDGAAIIRSGKTLAPGSLVRGRVTARTGFDVEVEV